MRYTQPRFLVNLGACELESLVAWEPGSLDYQATDGRVQLCSLWLVVHGCHHFHLSEGATAADGCHNRAASLH